jgi:gamma-glutamyltranspeptidase/glutathione hydrolase
MIKLVSPILLDTPDLAAYFKREDQLVQAGDVIRYPLLANTLEKLAQHGPDLFYTGEIAQAIVMDQRRKGGFVTATDLKSYTLHQVAPIEVPYRDYTLLLPSSASMGGVLIAFSLKLLTEHSLSGVKPHGVEHIRLLAEVMRLTNQARISWDVKRNQEGALDYFLSEAHLANYRRLLKSALSGQTTPDPTLPPSPPNTTHISVADQNGMIVALTHSPGENAGFVLGETGVTLNNMLGEMDLHPKGFHLLAPGERLQTMMAPVLALKDGRPMLAIGSGGSNRLRTAILQTVVNFIDFGMPLEQAILAPRVHFEEETLQLEGGIDPEVAFHLDNLYQVNRWTERSMFFGGAHAVAREGDHWTAAGDPRRGGNAQTVA